MPLALDPNATVEYSLKLDAGKPPEQRPVFLLRHLSCRDVLRARQLLDNAVEEKDAVKGNELLNAVLAIGLAGWRNIDRTFAADNFDDVLTPGEKGELAYACVTEPRLREHDLKNSASAQS
jgi:hypothetical protein